ncbi:hypothetical protein DSC47_09140 [Elizabethkingia miricola]|uniref:Uncharacterized protein n=1 Tax=Elizabethkingia bruuniana TaxID=1756149 RepID=A0A7T7UWT3_9FLAO|nr:hypothetical protein [Elizabethkingia bruuniana]KGO10123.1 hypothetical protein KS04_10310 [Elizabethkingia miricola]AQX84187.1 hypothetical protein AYC65_03745 [Elizabethkingia bruuniana]KUY28364.1 hypothetical protein ATB97_15740 [Elizabethkingia bruuniana]OPB64605.1 hypothetical protein BAY12_07385 [Elizabethkingia bruuniana]OPC54827.1 hypothetical protein BAY07_18200 [Elizabethkingia bruuniana]
MRAYIPIKYLYSLILIITGSLYNAQSVIAYGTDWTLAPTITEAGTNYTGTYETSATAPYQMTLTVSMPALLGAATVTVRYMKDPTWDNSLGLAVKRLNNGTSLCVLCSLTGGTEYIPLALTDVQFFKVGTLLALTSFNDIGLQLRLTGVSVTVPAAAYKAKILFTIGSP